jgi:hypothetical protein
MSPSLIDGCIDGETGIAAADAEHIAGMDPGTTLRLVAEVERLRAQVAELATGGGVKP